MIVTFPSTTNPENIRFGYDSDLWNSAPVFPRFTYTKLKDGEISWPANAILSVDLAGDYFISLAQVMVKNDDLCRDLRWRFTSGPSEDELNFAAKIVFKSKKTRYYSRELRKITATSSKQYDRRYEKITEDMNGSPSSMFAILGTSSSGIVRYACAYAIHKWLNASRSRWRKWSMDLPAQVLNWTHDYDSCRAIQAGWEACLQAIEIYNLRQKLEGSVETYNQYAMVAKLGQ